MTKGVGVILAGGKATRLGGISKAEILIGRKSCFERARDILAPEVDIVALSSLRKPGMETIADWPHTGRGGVAYALLSSLFWAKSAGYDYMITLPVDTPFLPKSYAGDLKTRFDLEKKPVVYNNGFRVQGLHALWPIACFEALKKEILDAQNCKVGSLHAKLESKELFSVRGKYDPFFNLNTPDDIMTACLLAGKYQI